MDCYFRFMTPFLISAFVIAMLLSSASFTCTVGVSMAKVEGSTCIEHLSGWRDCNINECKELCSVRHPDRTAANCKSYRGSDVSVCDCSYPCPVKDGGFGQSPQHPPPVADGGFY